MILSKKSLVLTSFAMLILSSSSVTMPAAGGAGTGIGTADNVELPKSPGSLMENPVKIIPEELKKPILSAPPANIDVPSLPADYKDPKVYSARLKVKACDLKLPGWSAFPLLSSGNAFEVVYGAAATASNPAQAAIEDGPPANVADVSAQLRDDLTRDLGVDSVKLINEYGAIGTLKRRFRRGQRTVDLTVLAFPTPDGSYGAYHTLRRGSTTVVQRGDGSSEDDQSISFWQGRYCALLSTTASEDDEAKEAVKSLADRLCAVIHEHAGPPRILFTIPHIDMVHSSEKLVMGPLAARRLMPAPYISNFSFQHARVGVIADYAYPIFKERMRMMCVQYDSPGAAEAAYDSYVSNFDEDHKNLAPEMNLADATVVKSNKTYVYAAPMKDRVIVITGGHKKSSALLLSRYFN